MPVIGEVIGDRYELRRLFERQGLAVIYQAHDRVRDRAVRIKWIAYTNEYSRALLTREARLTALLADRTSGTLAYHDLVEHAGELFLITEHVYGAYLRQWQEWGPSPQETTRVYAHLAQVLHEIHAANVVHRDVKPDHVMILADDDPAQHVPGSPARLKLLSLELAVLTTEPAPTTEPDTLTESGPFVGAAPYMSPEVFRGQDATSASDVFALGCMLVEALTGKRPWQMVGMGEMFGRLSEPPDLHGLAGSPLGDLVSAMLALAPEARPSAAEVARRLAAFENA